MDFKTIKSKFILYLQNKIQASGGDLQGINLSAKSIFLNQEDFKKFLQEECNITDSASLNIAVSDILKMNILDQNNQYDADEEDNEEANPNENDDTSDGKNWLSDLIKDLFSDKQVKSKIAGDDGIIEENELNSFLEQIKDSDGNSEGISLEDIFKTFDSIQDGSFKLENTEETSPEAEETPQEETPETTDTPTTTGDAPPTGGSNTNPNNTSNSTNPTGNGTDIQNDNSPKSLDQMSEAELNQEKSNAQSELDKNQSEYQSITDGSNSELSQLKENTDAAYKEYKEALDDDMAAELDKIVSDISKVESDISKKEIEISQQTTVVSNAKTTSENAQSTYEAMDAALTALKSQNTSNLDDEQKADLNSKIAAATARRDQAKTEAEKAKQDYEKEKDKLSDLEKELDNLNKGENGLDKLKADKAALEAKIDKNSDAGQLMTKYNEAKAKYDERKTELQSKAKEAVENSQKRIDEINVALNKVQNENEISEKYKFSNTADLFDSDVKMTRQMYTDPKTGMQYYLMAPEGTDPTKDELPMLLYLHGGTGGTYGQSSFESIKSSPGVFLKDTKFKGYIVCPVLSGGYNKWDDDRVAAKLDNFLDSFCGSHKVNKDKIALSGVSLGGSGTVYMASKLKKWFCKAAAISPARGELDTSNSKIPIKFFFGSNDGDNCISYQNYLLNKYKNADVTSVGNRKVKSEQVSHTWAAAKSYGITDADGNSALLKWLFS